MTGFRRAGSRHKKLVENFLGAVARGDEATALGALSSTAAITLGDENVIDVKELAGQLDGASWPKIIGSGSTVAVSVASSHGRGIVFADVAWRGSQINRIRYFPGF
jgi:hypothetical protein